MKRPEVMSRVALVLLNIRERKLTREAVQREYGAMLLEGLESHGFVGQRGQRVVLTETGLRRLAPEE